MQTHLMQASAHQAQESEAPKPASRGNGAPRRDAAGAAKGQPSSH